MPPTDTRITVERFVKHVIFAFCFLAHQQGADPDQFFVLTKGICKVVIHPDHAAALALRLKEVRFQLLKLSLSDVYHRSLHPGKRSRIDLTQQELDAINSLASQYQPGAVVLTDAEILRTWRIHGAGGRVLPDQMVARFCVLTKRT